MKKCASAKARKHKFNIFYSNMEVVTIPVNTVGVMGKGLALEFKNIYPEIFEKYKKDCNLGFHTGQVIYYNKSIYNDKGILLFSTKNHWKENSKIEYIEEGLLDFVCHVSEWNIKSIAFPALGCGLGGLNWRDVATLMINKLLLLPIDVEIYEPRE